MVERPGQARPAALSVLSCPDVSLCGETPGSCSRGPLTSVFEGAVGEKESWGLLNGPHPHIVPKIFCFITNV